MRIQPLTASGWGGWVDLVPSCPSGRTPGTLTCNSLPAEADVIGPCSLAPYLLEDCLWRTWDAGWPENEVTLVGWTSGLVTVYRTCLLLSKSGVNGGLFQMSWLSMCPLPLMTSTSQRTIEWTIADNKLMTWFYNYAIGSWYLRKNYLILSSRHRIYIKTKIWGQKANGQTVSLHDTGYSR